MTQRLDRTESGFALYENGRQVAALTVAILERAAVVIFTGEAREIPLGLDDLSHLERIAAEARVKAVQAGIDAPHGEVVPPVYGAPHLAEQVLRACDAADEQAAGPVEPRVPRRTGDSIATRSRG